MTESNDLREFIEHFQRTFEKRPGMLGNAVEIHGMLWVLDQLKCLSTSDKVPARHRRTWSDFLIEKRLIREGRHELLQELMRNPNDFSRLQELRAEYDAWLTDTEEGP